LFCLSRKGGISMGRQRKTLSKETVSKTSLPLGFPFPCASLAFEQGVGVSLTPNSSLLAEDILPSFKGDSLPFNEFLQGISFEDRERAEKDFRLFFLDHEAFRESYRFLTKTGKRFVEISCAYAEDCQNGILIFADVEEEKESDLALQTS